MQSKESNDDASTLGDGRSIFAGLSFRWGGKKRDGASAASCAASVAGAGPLHRRRSLPESSAASVASAPLRRGRSLFLDLRRRSRRDDPDDDASSTASLRPGVPARRRAPPAAAAAGPPPSAKSRADSVADAERRPLPRGRSLPESSAASVASAPLRRGRGPFRDLRRRSRPDDAASAAASLPALSPSGVRRPRYRPSSVDAPDGSPGHAGAGGAAGRALGRGRRLLGDLRRRDGADDASVAAATAAALRPDVPRADPGAPRAGVARGRDASGGRGDEGGGAPAAAAATAAAQEEGRGDVKGGAGSSPGPGVRRREVANSDEGSRGSPDAGGAPAVAQEGTKEDEETWRRYTAEELDRQKRERRQLKQAKAGLERQLADAAARLREAETASASSAGALERAVKETRTEAERSAAWRAGEAHGRGMCVEGLRARLVRQARAIKQRKEELGRHEARRKALRGEMIQREERAGKRAEERRRLHDRCNTAAEQRGQAQRLLQESVEDMAELKAKAERDVQKFQELKSDLQQKEAVLERLTKEESEASNRIHALEQEFNTKSNEVMALTQKTEASKTFAEEAKKELESKREELDELRRDNGAADQDATKRDAVEGNRAAAEVRQATLRERDATISSLHDRAVGHEATIHDLHSKVVKMTSSYKSEDYLLDKELARLRETRAKYEFRLRALRPALWGVAGGGGDAAAGPEGRGPPTPGTTPRTPGTPRRESWAASPPAAPLADVHPSPSERQRSLDSQIVMDANFFGDAGSGPSIEVGRRGDLAGEC